MKNYWIGVAVLVGLMAVGSDHNRVTAKESLKSNEKV